MFGGLCGLCRALVGHSCLTPARTDRLKQEWLTDEDRPAGTRDAAVGRVQSGGDRTIAVGVIPAGRATEPHRAGWNRPSGRTSDKSRYSLCPVFGCSASDRGRVSNGPGGYPFFGELGTRPK